jgi:hypothetical protein
LALDHKLTLTANWNENYINHVFFEIISPVDSNAKAAVVSELKSRLGPLLPADLQAVPPQDFMASYQQLVRAYMASLTPLIENLRSH